MVSHAPVFKHIDDNTREALRRLGGFVEILGSMFRLSRATQPDKEKLLAAAQQAPLSSPHLLTLTDGPVGTPPRGFAHDLTRSEIGHGLDVFVAARKAFQRWQQFDLGWVQVVNGVPKVVPGELVAVEAHTAILWSVSVSRIVETVDTPTRFGFMYTTTALHVEEGQERFVLEFDTQKESVRYLIEAVSRPRHILARIGYPFSRAMQRRFARDSHARLRHYVLDGLAGSRDGVQDGFDVGCLRSPPQ
jgi:uncharacterized protein (UPF0548 family)